VTKDAILVHNACPDVPDGPKRVTQAGQELRNIKVTGWSKGKEAGHFADHAADMGIASQRAYTQAAKDLAKKVDDVIEAKVGNTLFKYDKTTDNILIINGGNRKIKTFFKASRKQCSVTYKYSGTRDIDDYEHPTCDLLCMWAQNT
jgi:hypothetical protein